MSVSIKDTAQAAGVCHSTVSCAVSHSPLVIPKTAERVQRLGQAMGYSPAAIVQVGCTAQRVP
jgi:DNA-binding LacI/PurR family transcriptional regulator